MSSSLQVREQVNFDPTVVLFGRDDAGKPHAAAFDAENADLAVKAASLMNMLVLRVEGEDQKGIAQQLPLGRVFASGKAFVPFVRASLYTRLVELAGDAAGLKAVGVGSPSPTSKPQAASDHPPATSTGSKVAGKTAEAPASSTRLEGWENIGIGSIVLASVAVDDGWWESEILGQNGEMYTLRWRDFPGERPFTRRRTQLALLPPSR